MADDEIERVSTAAKLLAHEAVCAERYGNLLERIAALAASLTELKGFMFRGIYYLGFIMLSTCGWLIIHYVLSK